jgi:hypothetical protein
MRLMPGESWLNTLRSLLGTTLRLSKAKVWVVPPRVVTLISSPGASDSNSARLASISGRPKT